MHQGPGTARTAKNSVAVLLCGMTPPPKTLRQDVGCDLDIALVEECLAKPGGLLSNVCAPSVLPCTASQAAKSSARFFRVGFGILSTR